jgi:hypothetical protein
MIFNGLHFVVVPAKKKSKLLKVCKKFTICHKYYDNLENKILGLFLSIGANFLGFSKSLRELLKFNFPRKI